MDDMFGIDYGGVQLPFDFDSWSEEHFPPTSQLTCEQLNPGVTLNNGNTEQQQVLAPSQAFPYEAKQEPCQMPDFSDFDWLMAPNFNHGGTTEDHGNADDSKPSIDTPLCQFIDENIFTASADIDENDAEMGGEASGVDDELPGSEGDKAGKYIVWSKEENECLRALHRAESYEALRNKRAVNWFNIAEKFNKKRRGAGKELKREQIYQHFYHLMDSITTCTPAEVQVVLALEEIGLSDEPIANFLDNGVREATKIMSIIKESKQKTKPLTDTDEEQRRQRFRRKITSYIGAVLAKVPLESSDNAALDQEPIEMSDTRRKWDASDTATKEEILRQLKKWVESDPKIKRKMHTIAPIGRPHKTMTLSKSISELARLLRPFRKAYRWRQRITYHPGDIRKSALSSFTLHRLLGAPFEVSKLPDARDEDADETRRVAAVTKSLIKKRPLEYPADGDKMSYFAMDVPPGESLLPPTLHTVAGIRGLLLHKTNLEETAREECEDDVDDEAASRSRVRRSERYGDAESDDKLMRCMLSLFYWPMRLCLKIVNNELVQLDNSDGDSDSDDEKCWPTGSVHWPGF